jgi:VCBS repeat-containing protein
MGFLNKLIILMMVIGMSACLPENGQKKAECASDKTYNTKTRTCDVSKIKESFKPPVGTLTSVAMTEDVAKTVELTYSDVDDNPVQACFITAFNTRIDDTPPTCSCSGGKCYATITPDLNEYGTSDFTYSVSDPDGTSASRLVNITITAVNDAPVASAVAETFNVTEDITNSGTLLAASDVDAGDTALLQYQISTNATSGSVTITPFTNGFTYTPNYNATGTDSFTYRAYDPSGAFSNVKTVSVNITAADDAPVIATISNVTVNEGASVVSSFTYSDIDSGFTAIACSATPANVAYITAGACTCLAGVCSVTLTAQGDYNNSIPLTSADRTITYGVTDVLAAITKTNIVTINAVNDVPRITNSAISFVATENSASTTSVIILDEGGGADENAQGLSLTIASSSTSLVSLANIQVYKDSNSNGVYDSGTDTSIGVASAGSLALGDATSNASASASNIFIKVTPSPYQSGDTDLTLTINDGQATNNSVSSVYSFHFNDTNDAPTISPLLSLVQSNEGGVTLVKAISVDEGAAAAGEDVQFLTVTVTSASAALVPNSSIQIYYDLDDDGLADSAEYKGLGGAAAVALGDGAADASLHKVLLKLDAVGGVSGSAVINLVVTDNLGTTGSSSFLYTVHPIGATHGGWKNILAVGAKVNKQGNTIASGKITLEWNEFSIAGSGATYATANNQGWRIYRREVGSDYNFSVPLNSGTIAPSVRSYDDTTANAGKVYFYVVRGIDNILGIDIATEEIYSEIRVVMPLDNLAFIHRWMANQEMCKLMHQDALIDPVENFRCPYRGPGEVLDAGSYYYDVGEDLFVDIGEVGCPYTAAPECSGNGCIGIVAPGGVTTGNSGSIFYNRSNGTCYVNTAAFGFSGTAWSQVEIAASATSVLSNNANLPPLVNVTQSKAKALCEIRTDDSITGYSASVAYTLPSRKDQIIYSAWNQDEDDFDVATYETGLNLNSSSKCNSSSANGLTGSYTDVTIPNSSTLFTLPGTASSGIRSIFTSSINDAVLPNTRLTPLCTSRYGVQDAIGNVSEWVVEKFDCSQGGGFQCYGDNSLSTRSSLSSTAATSLLYNIYRMDGVRGPCVDSDANGSCDAFFTDFAFDDEVFGANFMILPLGLPGHINWVTTYTTNEVTPFYYEVGPTNGITTGQLHDDGMEFESGLSGFSAALASGGDYTSVEKSGRYYMKLYKTTTQNAQTGFRCIAPLVPASYVTDSLHPYQAQY